MPSAFLQQGPTADVHQVRRADLHQARQVKRKFSNTLRMPFGLLVAQFKGMRPAFQGRVIGQGKLNVRSLSSDVTDQ
jgi:hypothetical protein